jgi:hypothetical protein
MKHLTYALRIFNYKQKVWEEDCKVLVGLLRRALLELETKKTKRIMERKKPCPILRESYYFKVNNTKLDKPKKLKHQIELAIKRLIKTQSIEFETYELKFGTLDDDFINDIFRLRISFLCTKQPK